MLFEKHNSFLRLLKNKGFKEESMTKFRLDAIGSRTRWLLIMSRDFSRTVLSSVNQLVISTRNAFSTLRPTQLACL
jgi:hypothetical protein